MTPTSLGLLPGFGLAFVGALLVPSEARAWLFHEHAAITERAVRDDLAHDTDVHPRFARIWQTARGGQTHLCDEAAARWHGDDRCTSLASLPALAGDHSCSPDDLDRVVREPWARQVIAEARRTAATLEAQPVEHDMATRLDVRREIDRRLLLIDPEFLSRAAMNFSHFDLVRRSDDLAGYLRSTLGAHEELNATGLYVAYHAAALYEAREAATCARATENCDVPRRLWRALILEVYALHFLEDSFAAGHVVGTWGDSAQRSGTHDHYSQHGLDVTTWGADARPSETYSAYGDAFMTDEDLRRASEAVAESLTQFTCAYVTGEAPAGERPARCEELRQPLDAALARAVRPAIDTCADTEMPPGASPLAEAHAARLFREVLARTPRPARRQPEVPRFTNEIGTFFALSLDLQGTAAWTGDGPVPEALLRSSGSVQFGVNASGVLSRYTDGRAFVGVGVVTELTGAGLQAGFRFHIRIPGAPWDILAWLARVTFGREDAFAVFYDSLSGGALIPRLHALHILSPSWAWQFTLGREAWVTWVPEQGSVRWALPVMALRAQSEFLGRIGTDMQLPFGVEFAQPDTAPSSVGVFLAASPTGRFYTGWGL